MWINYIKTNEAKLGGAGTTNEFSWDDKHAGAQILMANVREG